MEYSALSSNITELMDSRPYKMFFRLKSENPDIFNVYTERHPENGVKPILGISFGISSYVTDMFSLYIVSDLFLILE